ncbi:MAG: hypothetical protein OXG03_06815 [Gammaproteobacteria bacterium]|nr:hypothetical protein [Gammaproteobacteria bacterium]
MRSDPRVLLEDIDQAGSDLECFIENMDDVAYIADVQTQAAVEREFEIMGEALNQKQPNGPSLKLLNLVDRKGLDALG